MFNIESGPFHFVAVGMLLLLLEQQLLQTHRATLIYNLILNRLQCEVVNFMFDSVDLCRARAHSLVCVCVCVHGTRDNGGISVLIY